MENLSEPEKYIRRTMDATGLDVDTLAEAMGYSARTLKRMMSGEVKLSKFARERMENLVAGGTHALAKIGSAEAMSMREEAGIERAARKGTGLPNFPAGASRKMMIRRVPVIGWAKAGEAMEFEDIVDWESPIHTEVNDARAFAIRVKGDSMTPLISEGDMVVVTPSEEARSEQVVVAKLRDQGVVLKRIRRRGGGAIEFHSSNPFYPPFVVSAADVVWMYPAAQLIKKL